MGEEYIERRITYDFGVNVNQTLVGRMSFEQLIQHAVTRTEGPINVTKRETRVVNYSEWRDERIHQHEKWQLQESAKGGMYCAACGEDVP
jgi:hypothetical protein